jgi:dTMP kinase
MPFSTALHRQIRRRVREHFADPPARGRGVLVAFEGPDGSGKTTQRKLFKTWLKAEGSDVVTTKWNSSELIKPIVRSRKAIRSQNADRRPESVRLAGGA